MDEVLLFPSVIVVIVRDFNLFRCGSSENIRVFGNSDKFRLFHGFVLSAEKNLRAVGSVSKLHQIRYVGVQEFSVGLTECKHLVVLAAKDCRLKPPFGHRPVSIFGNHQVGLEGQQDRLVAWLAECWFVVCVVPSWCQLQHRIGGGEGHGTIETGKIGEQQTIADTVAHHIGTGQALNVCRAVGIEETVGIG